MVLYLDVRDRRILHAGFQTYGCAAAIAAGSLLTELILGRTIEDLAKLDAPTLRLGLGGLPLGKEHCADIAISALGDALRNLANGVAQ